MEETYSPSTSGTNTKRKNQCISNDIRKLIVERLNSGHSFTEVALVFKVKVDAVRKMYKTYQKSGSMVKKRGGHRRQLLNESQKETICDWVDSDCTLTLKQLVQKCFTEWQLVCGRSTVDRSLKEFYYTFKRTTPVPERRNTPQTIEKRYEYALKYNEMMADKDKMFFIDETGVQIWSRAKYGRAVKGLRAVKRVKAIRSRNYSIATAMNMNSLSTYLKYKTRLIILKIMHYI
jgi:transposase